VKSDHKKWKPRKAGLRRDFFISNQGCQSLSDEYRNVGKLGEGAFGVVYEVEKKDTHEPRVMKVINKRNSAVPAEELEVRKRLVYF